MLPSIIPHLSGALDHSKKGGGKGLTLNGKYNVGPPYSGRDGYYSPILIPNSDSGGLNKLRKGVPGKYLHTKHDYQRRGGGDQVR